VTVVVSDTSVITSLITIGMESILIGLAEGGRLDRRVC
jgi:hypothetical protein